MRMVGRNDPEAARMLAKADRGYVAYNILSNTAEAAKGTAGVFGPGQLATSTTQAAKKYSRRSAGKGEGRLQNLADAAVSVLPDQFGNPGTANVLSAGAGLTGLATAPLPTVAAGAGLGVAATPYLMMGRRTLEQLPANPTRVQLETAFGRLNELSALDPAVVSLRNQVAARLGLIGGAIGGRTVAAQ
jgi:hypothetical protein